MHLYEPCPLFAKRPGDWRKYWTPVFMCLFLVFSSWPADSRSVLDLDASKQPIALGDWGEYWIDSTGQLAPEQVEVSVTATWQPTPVRGIYPLKAHQTLWIRFTVPPAPDAERWVLDIPYPALDRASLYTKDTLGQFTEQRAGDLTAVSSWLTPHRHPLLNVAFNAEVPTQYLLRLENGQGFSAPLRFVSASRLLRDEQFLSMSFGAYFAIAALGCGLGLIGFVWQRDRAYLYYGVCSGLVGLTLAAISGVAGLHLWPNSPVWADKSQAILGTLTLLVFTWTNATLVSLAERSKRLNAWVLVLALAGLVVAALIGTTDSAFRLPLFMPYLVVVVATVLWLNLWGWRRGDRFGGWLLLAVAPFTVAGLIAAARYMQWIPHSLVTEHGIAVSMAILLPAQLAVLLMRSQQRRENQRRLLGLDRVDPATGLITEQVFTERLHRMSARSGRLKHHSAVLLLEVVNTEQIQRDYGRKLADELPLRVASRLLSTLRDIDSAARLSERRFGLLVEGPISAEEAATLGPRVIARCLMPFAGVPVDCVAQVKVAYTLVPKGGDAVESMVALLQERLTAALTVQDKRSVFSL